MTSLSACFKNGGMVLAVEAPLPAEVTTGILATQSKETEVAPRTTFDKAHLGEILQDLHTVLTEKNIDVNSFIYTTSSTEVAHLAKPLPEYTIYQRKEDVATSVTRGMVIYHDGGELKGIGFDAFENGSIRTIAARQDESGGLQWMLLRDLPENEKVRQKGSWKDQDTGIEIPLFERAGDTVVRMLTDAPVEGRVAQAHVRNQINPTLPKGIDLPDYANKYLPTHGRKK